MKPFYYFYILMILNLGNSLFTQSEDSDSKKIYNTILKTSGLFDKQKMAITLGRNGSQAESHIILLMKNENYWNRSAGIFAAGESNSQQLGQELISIYLNDHMTKTDSKTILQKNISKWERQIFVVFEKENSIDKKKELLQILEASQSIESENFLKKEISKRTSPIRIEAFKILSKTSKTQNDEYLRSFLEDKSLRISTLDYIYQNGNSNDKQLMLTLWNDPKASVEEKMISLHGLKKWGRFSEQKKVLLQALQSGVNNSIMVHALFLFGEIRSPEIMSSLCNLSLKGKSQEIRILSAEKLIPYQDPVNIRCLRNVVSENYESQSTSINAGDVFIGILSFGLSSIFKTIQENQNKQSFYDRQSRIKEHVQFLELMRKD